MAPAPTLTQTLTSKTIDIVERAVATFAQAFLAIEIGDQSNITQVSALKVAAIAGGLAVAKYLFILSGQFLAKNPPTA